MDGMTPQMAQLRIILAVSRLNFEQAQKQLREAQSAVDSEERKCSHTRWSAPKQCTHTIPGYKQVSVWWERTCLDCEKVERTDKSKPSGEVVPVFQSH